MDYNCFYSIFLIYNYGFYFNMECPYINFLILLLNFVALPATIDNIFSGGDTSLVMDEINMDLDLSFLWTLWV